MKKSLLVFGFFLVSLAIYYQGKEEVIHRTSTAMGSLLKISITKMNLANSQKIINKIQKIDNLLSSYKKNSEISILNKNKSLHHFSNLTYKVLQQSLNLYTQSQGLFDISLGGLNTNIYKMRQWSKANNKTKARLLIQIKKKLKLLKPKRSLSLHKKLKLQNDSIYLLHNNRVDLGGIGKGFAVEEAAKLLNKNGSQASIQLSGDIFCLHKCFFSIREPYKNSTKVLVQLKAKITQLSISTSGNYEKTLKEKIHHIINPYTRRPSTFFKSVSLIAKNQNTKIDALATGIAAGSLTRAKKILEKQKIGAFLIGNNNKIYINNYFFALAKILTWGEKTKDFTIIKLDTK